MTVQRTLEEQIKDRAPVRALEALRRSGDGLGAETDIRPPGPDRSWSGLWVGPLIFGCLAGWVGVICAITWAFTS